MQFKGQSNLFAGETLKDIFIMAIQTYYAHPPFIALPDLIVPVPLHWKKHSLRGFNQSAFFAQALSRTFTIPVLNGVKRSRAMTEQKQLNKQRRRHNAKNSFVISAKSKQRLHNQHVAIVDDVMTTGATVNMLAKALIKAGAASVSVWVLARTPKKN